MGAASTTAPGWCVVAACLAVVAGMPRGAGVPAIVNAVGSNQARMFAQADAYEVFMGRWSRRMAPLLLQFARVKDGQAILDVGSGTGSLSMAAASLAPTSEVTGVDLSPAYVERARQAAAGPRVRFEVGDAQALRYGDGSFDRTLSLFVINFVPDSRKALTEMIRVTRPGGIVAAAVWDYGDGMEMLRVFWDEAGRMNPSADSRDERHMPLCKKGQLSELWRERGLTEVVEQSLTVPMEFRSFDDYWQPFLGGQGPAGEYVGSLPTDQVEQLRDRLRMRLLAGKADGPFTLKGRAWAVCGTVPPRRH